MSTRPFDSSRNATERLDSARLVSASVAARVSVLAERRNLARAGTLKNRLRTTTVVPGCRAQSSTAWMRPPATRMRVPTPPGSAVSSRNRDTDAMDGSASPRNPNVTTAARSSGCAILLVA